MARQIHTGPVSETSQILGVCHLNPFPIFILVITRASWCIPLHQLPLFAICDFLLEELPFLRMNADLTAFHEAESQFSFLFTWMDRLSGFHPVFGLQAGKLAEKWAEAMAWVILASTPFLDICIYVWHNKSFNVYAVFFWIGLCVLVTTVELPGAITLWRRRFGEWDATNLNYVNAVL